MKEPDSDFFYVDINRTGSSSMRKALGYDPGEQCHRTALHLRNRYGDAFREGFVFSVVRNPYSRAVSQFKHRNILHADETDFDDWVREVFLPPYKRGRPNSRHGEKLWWPQVRWLTDEEGEFIVDTIFHFEGLQTVWWRLQEYADLEGDLPHLNAARDRTPWSLFYTDEGTRQIVRTYYGEDFDRLEYDISVNNGCFKD